MLLNATTTGKNTTKLLYLCTNLSTSYSPKVLNRRFMTALSAKDAAVKPVIIGGGISGLAVAAALQNIAGISSQVIEKRTYEEFHNSLSGAGAQIGPNGLRALRAIGGEELMQKCIDSGSVLKGNFMILPGMPEPMLIPDTAEEDTGLPQVFVRWGVLREMLADQLSESSILTDTGGNVRGYKVNEDGGVHLVTDKAGDTFIDHGEANLIVSAEGVRSTFRYFVNNNKDMIGHDEDQVSLIKGDVKDTGRINIKAIVPRDLDESFQPSHTYAWFAQNGGVGCFAGPAGSGHTYWAISIADSVDEETGETSKFLSDVDRNDFDTIKSTLLSKLRSLDAADCQFAIDLVDESTPERIYVTRSEEAIKIGPSLQKDGKVALVGDSAHAMSGSYGQNPNFALEDAAVLACSIRDSSSIESALESYSEQRVSRCLEMQHRGAERAAKAMKGEQVEDVSKWIFQWDIQR
jgi:2-polyprenyl-6-methoxyphenol hydroxylase-like FAD-dependent oxidoreductase